MTWQQVLPIFFGSMQEVSLQVPDLFSIATPNDLEEILRFFVRLDRQRNINFVNNTAALIWVTHWCLFCWNVLLCLGNTQRFHQVLSSSMPAKRPSACHKPQLGPDACNTVTMIHTMLLMVKTNGGEKAKMDSCGMLIHEAYTPTYRNVSKEVSHASRI